MPDLSSLVAAAAGERRAVRLLFVCTGNICRSPLAHAVFDHAAEERSVGRFFGTESAGLSGYHVGENADERMRACAGRHGVRLDHPARLLAPGDLDYFDLVLAMDSDHHARLSALAGGGSGSGRILLYREFDPEGGRDVPDPYYGTAKDFEQVWRITERCTAVLLGQLLAAMKGFAASP